MEGTVGDDNKSLSVEEELCDRAEKEMAELCSQVAQGFRTYIKEIQSENRSPEMWYLTQQWNMVKCINIADRIQAHLRSKVKCGETYELLVAANCDESSRTPATGTGDPLPHLCNVRIELQLLLVMIGILSRFHQAIQRNSILSIEEPSLQNSLDIDKIKNCLQDLAKLVLDSSESSMAARVA